MEDQICQHLFQYSQKSINLSFFNLIICKYFYLFFLYKYSYFYIISIKSIRESGLYNNWIQLFLKLLGNTQFIQQEVNHNIVKFEEMSFNHMLDVFYLYIFGLILSLILLLNE